MVSGVDIFYRNGKDYTIRNKKVSIVLEFVPAQVAVGNLNTEKVLLFNVKIPLPQKNCKPIFVPNK